MKRRFLYLLFILFYLFFFFVFSFSFRVSFAYSKVVSYFKDASCDLNNLSLFTVLERVRTG